MPAGRLKFHTRLRIYILLALIICVFVLATVFSIILTQVIDEYVHQTTIENLGHLAANMETALLNIDFLASQVAIDPSLSFFAAHPFHADYLRLKNLINSIDNHTITNPLVSSIYLYYRDNPALITAPYAKVDIGTFHDNGWIQELSMDEQPQWLFGTTADGAHHSSRLTFIKYFPLGSLWPQGAVMINMDTKELAEHLARFTGDTGGIQIRNGQGQIILSTFQDGTDLDVMRLYPANSVVPASHGPVRLDNRLFAVATGKGAYEWQYIMVQPLEKLFSMRRIAQNIIVLCTVCILLVVIKISSLVSAWLYKPVEHLVKVFKATEPPEQDEASTVNAVSTLRYDILNRPSIDEFGYLETSINSLISRHDQLVRKGKAAASFAIEGIVLGLLNGNVHSSDLKEFGADMRLDRLRSYLVIVTELDDFARLLTQRPLTAISGLQSAILRRFDDFRSLPGLILLQAVSTCPQQTACLLAFDSPASVANSLILDICALCEELRNATNQHFGVQLTTGISMVGDCLDGIHVLHEQASHAVRYRMYQGGNAVRCYGWIDFVDEQAFVYPLREEQQLLRALVERDRSAARAAIRSFAGIMQAYTIREDRQIYYIFSQLLGSMTRSAGELGSSVGDIWQAEDIYRRLSDCTCIDQMESLLYELASRYIEFFEERMKSKNSSAVSLVLRYMRDNVGNGNLSIEQIATQAFMSPSHLEKILKEVTGKTAMEQLLEMRMTEARQLLRKHDLKIEDIAGKVGYQSSRGFIRAFKKVQGMTPGQYRDNHCLYSAEIRLSS
jgi:AraC-like DNA-binding protein